MAKLPESKARRLQDLNQDVLAVAPAPVTQVNKPQPRPQMHRQPAPAQADHTRPVLSLVALSLAAAAMLFAAFMWISQQQAAQELAQLRQDYYQLAEDVAANGGKVTPPTTASVVRTNGIDALRDDVRVLSGKVRSLTVALAKQGQEADNLAPLQARLDELGTGLNTVNARISALAAQQAQGASPAAPAASADTQQLQELESRITKLDKDMQALYRVLQGG